MHPAHVPDLQLGQLVFDGQRLLLLGDPEGGGRLEAWGWNGSDWAYVSTSNVGTTLVGFDAGHQNVVGFGGGPVDDTWTWNGSAWSRQHPKHSPAGAPASLLYDKKLGRVIGFAGTSQGPIAGIYAWDGSDWSAIGPTPAPVVAAGNNLMNAGDALALIRRTVTATHPVLLPQVPQGVTEAFYTANANGFELNAMTDDRSIQVSLGILIPGNSNLGAANKDISFRGTVAYYQYIAGDSTAWRSLWWTERPGHWADPYGTGMKGGDGVPYVLAASGLTEAQFFALAGSLS